MARAPFDATEPPNGDFARYIERLEQQAAAAPAPAGPLSAEHPAPSSSTLGKPLLRRRSTATPGAFPITRAAWWLIGAGLAIRKHFAKNRKSR